MSADDDSTPHPRSMRHKQILDVAEKNLDASIDEIASKVPSATSDLVEHVFDEYGDPAAENDPSPSSEASASSESEGVCQKDNLNTETMPPDNSADFEETDDQEGIGEEDYPQLDDLPKQQRELVEAIAAQPEITQRELGDQFDVAMSTINRRVNNIEGFEWSDRESFVEAVCDGQSSTDVNRNGDSPETVVTNASHTDTGDSGSNREGKTTEKLEDIHAEIKRLNQRVANLEKSFEEPEKSSDSVFEDPELIYKIIHLSIESDRITETEEFRMLKELMK